MAHEKFAHEALYNIGKLDTIHIVFKSQDPNLCAAGQKDQSSNHNSLIKL